MTTAQQPQLTSLTQKLDDEKRLKAAMSIAEKVDSLEKDRERLKNLLAKLVNQIEEGKHPFEQGVTLTAMAAILNITLWDVADPDDDSSLKE